MAAKRRPGEYGMVAAEPDGALGVLHPGEFAVARAWRRSPKGLVVTRWYVGPEPGLRAKLARAVFRVGYWLDPD